MIRRFRRGEAKEIWKINRLLSLEIFMRLTCKMALYELT